MPYTASVQTLLDAGATTLVDSTDDLLAAILG